MLNLKTGRFPLPLSLTYHHPHSRCDIRILSLNSKVQGWSCSDSQQVCAHTFQCEYRFISLSSPCFQWHTYLLTPWCRVLLEKLTGLQLVKKFPAFYGTRRFITALTTVRHLSLSWASPIQSIYPHPTSWRSVLILSTHLRLGLPSGLFPSCVPNKIIYTPLSSDIQTLNSNARISLLCIFCQRFQNILTWETELCRKHIFILL